MLVKRKFAQLAWKTGEGHDAKTADLEGVTGILHAKDIKIGKVTGNADLTVTVTFTDRTDTVITKTLETFSGLAHTTLHRYLRESKEYDADKDIDGHVFCGNDLRISVDPNEDAGGDTQTLAVDVTLYLEE